MEDLFFSLAMYLILAIIAIFIIFVIWRWQSNRHIEIKFDQDNYKLGEPITGKVILKFNQPKEAKSLKLYLNPCFHGTDAELQSYGSIAVLSPNRTFNPGEIIPFEMRLFLDSKLKHQYLKLPPTRKEYDALIKRNNNSRPYWLLEACLDVPGEFGIMKKMEVNVDNSLWSRFTLALGDFKIKFE